MKQTLLIAIMIIFFLSFYSIEQVESKSKSKMSRSKRSERSTRSKSNLKSKSKQNVFNKLAFNNEGYMALSDIGAYLDTVWACTLDGRYFKYNPAGTTIQAAISGASVFTGNETCSRVATNKNGDLFVVTSKNNLNLLKRVTDNSFSWTQISANVTDVATSPNSESYAITSDGHIYQIFGANLSPRLFSTQNFGPNCRLAVNYEQQPIVYVVDSNSTLWRVSLDKTTKIDIDLIPVDISVGANYNLYIASTTGIYRKKTNVDKPIKLADGIASQLTAGNKLWINGIDSFPYSALLETPAGGI